VASWSGRANKKMRHAFSIGVLALILSTSAQSKVVVFWQPGFPTVESQPISQEVLNRALGRGGVVYAGVGELTDPQTLRGADLLVLPYGSAFPASAWKPVLGYLESGGNLLTIGGRALQVPVYSVNGQFVQGRLQNSYARGLGIAHTYAVPQKDLAKFAWDEAAPSFHPIQLHPQRVYVLAMGFGGMGYHGIGYMLDAHGARVAAPVTADDFVSLQPQSAAALRGDRCVFLNFDPQPGFWSSPDGITLIRESAAYASRGATLFWVEMRNVTVARGEAPECIVHFRNALRQRRGQAQEGIVKLSLYSGQRLVSSKQVVCSGDTVHASVDFPQTPSPGLYRVNAIYQDGGRTWERYETGYWSRDEALLHSGSALIAGPNYFRANGQPFLPVGTNYFSTDRYARGFEGGNAYVWNRDFAEMENRGITFVRTGIWNNQERLIDPLTGGVNERFLRGLEAFLLSAANHHIQVNFTFTAFDPQTIRRYPGETSEMLGPGTNPYTDPVAVRAEQNYDLSIVSRFRDVPFLSWDLINEPSFSNPKLLWIGNVPNNDPTERKAWNEWLARRYGSVQKLATAWNTTPSALGAFGGIPLPSPDDLKLTRYGNLNQDRAFDYNLFAQDMFSHWVQEMVSALRSTGSKQLIDVGQDEGGVTNRLLDQFFGGAGVSFTVNHTYWHDDALLWDSVVAKRVGMPDFVGETGVQPVWRIANSWRWDEITAAGLMERKFALGFAAANSGALQWDWENGDDFGIKRRDGSEKIWEDILSGVAQFALKATPYAQGAQLPQTAIVLPQSLQLSVFNPMAVEAQQNCVRALFDYARSSAYAVGEYQIQLLAHPKLIILPSPWALSSRAWNVLLQKVREGAVLLVSGRFDLDPHFHPTGRQHSTGIDYTPALLAERMAEINWPDGHAWLAYPGEDTNYLERGELANGKTFEQASLGSGKILYFALPLEMNDNLKAVGDVYRFALATAGIKPVYVTDCNDPGISICPTALRSATLDVVTSESAATTSFAFRDEASGKQFHVTLHPGRAALLLISHAGQVVASYGYSGQ
jgi:hypothetical protein